MFVSRIIHLYRELVGSLTSYYHRDGFLLTLSGIFYKISSLLTTLFIVRLLSVESYGIITYGRSLVSIASNLTGFGLYHSLLYYGMDQDEENKKKCYIWTLKLTTITILPFVGICLVVFYFLSLNINDSFWVVCLLTLQYIPLSYFSVRNSYYRIKKNNKKFAEFQILYSLAIVLVSVVLTKYWGILGYCISYILVPLLLLISSPEKGGSDSGFTKPKVLEYILYGSGAGISWLLNALFISIDVLILGSIVKDPANIGIYKNGVFILNSLSFIPVSFMTTDFVYITENKGNYNYLKAKLKQFMVLFFVFAFLLSIVILLSSHWLTLFLFGKAYLDSIPILRLSCIPLLFQFTFKIPIENYFLATGKVKKITGIMLAAILITIILSLWLYPLYSILGISYAYSISTIILSGLLVVVLARDLRKLNRSTAVGRST